MKSLLNRFHKKYKFTKKGELINNLSINNIVEKNMYSTDLYILRENFNFNRSKILFNNAVYMKENLGNGFILASPILSCDFIIKCYPNIKMILKNDNKAMILKCYRTDIENSDLNYEFIIPICILQHMYLNDFIQEYDTRINFKFIHEKEYFYNIADYISIAEKIQYLSTLIYKKMIKQGILELR